MCSCAAGSRPKQSSPRAGLWGYGECDEFCIFPVPFNFLRNMSVFFIRKKYFKKKVVTEEKDCLVSHGITLMGALVMQSSRHTSGSWISYSILTGNYTYEYCMCVV